MNRYLLSVIQILSRLFETPMVFQLFDIHLFDVLWFDYCSTKNSNIETSFLYYIVNLPMKYQVMSNIQINLNTLILLINRGSFLLWRTASMIQDKGAGWPIEAAHTGCHWKSPTDKNIHNATLPAAHKQEIERLWNSRQNEWGTLVTEIKYKTHAYWWTTLLQGGWGLIYPQRGHCFPSIFHNSRNNN